MFGLNLNRFGAVALLVALSGTTVAQGESKAVPPATSGEIASQQFRPLTEADVQSDFAQVKAAAAALDQRFAAAGASAKGWKEYLSWDAFQAELRKSKPDSAILTDVYHKLAAGHEGLELKWFANLRTVLGNYVAIAGSVGNAALAGAVKNQEDELAAEVKALGQHPTTEETRKIDDHLLWLAMARQSPEALRAVRGRFSQQNFHVQIARDLLEMGVGGPVDEIAPIDDVILGTTIHGTGRTVGQTRAVLSDSPAFATFDALLEATNYGNSVGRNGPVCIYTTSRTGLAACKRFWIDEDGIHTYPTAANAQTSTTINNIVSIKGRKFVERIAWRKAGKQKCEAEAIAGQHAAGRVAGRVNAQADPAVAQANARYESKIRRPLEERRAFPRQLSFATHESGLEINGTAALDTQLAAPSAAPELTRSADISVRIHESAINNLAENVLTGMRLNDDMVQRTAVALTGSVPEKLRPDQNQEPFTIVFPAEQIPRVQPVTVTFADEGFSVTLRGSEYFTGDRRQPGMDITAHYKFVKTPDGYNAVRQGDLVIYGFGQKPGAKRAFVQQSIYIALQKKFGKIFEPEIKLKGFKFAQGKLAAAGQFTPQEIISRDGWLVVGYSRAKPANGLTAANN